MEDIFDAKSIGLNILDNKLVMEYYSEEVASPIYLLFRVKISPEAAKSLLVILNKFLETNPQLFKDRSSSKDS